MAEINSKSLPDRQCIEKLFFNTNSHELKAEFSRIVVESIRVYSIKIRVDSCLRKTFSIVSPAGRQKSTRLHLKLRRVVRRNFSEGGQN